MWKQREDADRSLGLDLNPDRFQSVSGWIRLLLNSTGDNEAGPEERMRRVELLTAQGDLLALG